MSAKNVKKAKKLKIKLDKVRPLIFNFNTFCILSEFEKEPYTVMQKMETLNPKAIRSMVYACLTAGLQLDDEDAELDLTRAEVGELIGQMMFDESRQDEFKVVMEELGKAVDNFFPDAPKSEQKDSDEEGATQTEEEGDEKN